MADFQTSQDPAVGPAAVVMYPLSSEFLNGEKGPVSKLLLLSDKTAGWKGASLIADSSSIDRLTPAPNFQWGHTVTWILNSCREGLFGGKPFLEANIWKCFCHILTWLLSREGANSFGSTPNVLWKSIPQSPNILPSADCPQISYPFTSSKAFFLCGMPEIYLQCPQEHCGSKYSRKYSQLT